MTIQIEPNWKSKDQVQAAWFFGAQVKGTANEDSVLHLGVQLTGTKSDSTTEWILRANFRRHELRSHFPNGPEFDLQPICPEEDEVVWQATKDHGIKLFHRTFVE